MSWKTDFRSRDIAKNNFSGIDISQAVDLEPPSLSPYFLLSIFIKVDWFWSKHSLKQALFTYLHVRHIDFAHIK